jgi:DNA-binding GntR family transcriptional regulator
VVKKIVTNRDIRTQAYDLIRSHIASDAVPAGGKINEDELAQSLGVSKTPVRDALAKLSLEGYVQIVPNRGAFKVKFSPNDVAEIMAIREVLEGLAIRLAAPNMTDKTIKKLRDILTKFDEKQLVEDFSKWQQTHDAFYELIYRTAKSPRLMRLIQSMYEVLKDMMGRHYFRTPERILHSENEKCRLLDALEKGDVELAESIRRELVRSTRDILMREIV